MTKLRIASVATLLLTLTVLADPAAAYTGPGLGLGALATAFGIIGALFLGLVSIIWYPIKRLVRKLTGAPAPSRRSRRA